MVYTFCIPMHPMGKARPRVYSGVASLPPKYRQWKQAMVIYLKPMWCRDTIFDDISVKTWFYTKTGNCRSDLDNAHAACLDSLQDARIINNDKQVKSGAYEIKKSVDGKDLIMISIEKI